jgi:hypothetical protein
MMLGVISVPEFLNRPTGTFLLDVVPCASLVATFPTLKLYWLRRRYGDFAIYSLGFLLALVYHGERAAAQPWRRAGQPAASCRRKCRRRRRRRRRRQRAAPTPPAPLPQRCTWSRAGCTARSGWAWTG